MIDNNDIVAMVKNIAAPPKEPDYEAEIEELVRMHSTDRRRMRREPELWARFKKGCVRYKELKFSRENVREQQVMLYAELKVLGWVLGMDERKVIEAINY